MSGFLSGSVNWLRRSFSEHERVERKIYSRFRSSLEGSSTPNSEVVELFLPPELKGGNSSILVDEELVVRLCGYFPPRLTGSNWISAFSTNVDGFSLSSLYRRLAGTIEAPVLLAIKDTQGNSFGALVSEPFRIQELFYGTGQSFLFRLCPDFRVWPWSTENEFFISSSLTSLRIGAGNGHFGLSIDGDLNLGRTQRCSTYNNEPLVNSEDFVIQTLEVWTFGL